MKKNTLTVFKVTLILLSLNFSSAKAQNKEDVSKIVKEYDLTHLKKLEIQAEKKLKTQKDQALKAAKINNWPEFIKNEDGSVDELMKLTPDGFPLYFSSNNKNASKSTRANFLNTGGGLGLTLDGQGMVARVWDGGKVRASHQEFGSRVTVVDAVAGSTGNNFHATHVTGTIIASGVDPDAKGMAPQARARTFNWTNDESEALAEVQQGMLLSNHSYGVPIVNDGQFVPSWYIGAYSGDSRAWDEISYNAPYYLMVVSAGNNGSDDNPQPSTFDYDKLTGNKTSKNNLVVANAQDASISAAGVLTSVLINSSSSQGPADDFRIKPDITGNGTNVYSTFESSNSAYGSISGTSMSAPNVTGTLLLLQQHYKNKNNRFMKAATLKALACHTADDAGRPGPDAVFGWGLLNAKKAAEAINANGLASIITEESLAQNQSYTVTVNSNGVDPLQASIVWTDVPGNANDGVLNSTIPALVNDLDIRITKNTATFYPYKLTSNANANATNNSDNNVDNVEKINVPAANGTYTITVTHKGTLFENRAQDFSLVVTGVTSNFSLTPLSEDQISCTTGSATYLFNQVSSSVFETTNFSAEGLPNGAIATFSPSSLNESGDVSMTISNLQNALPGDYTIGFKGIRGSESETKYVGLTVYSSTFQNVVLASPENNSEGLANNVTLAWEPNVNAETYTVQVATDSNFTNLIINQSVTQNEYALDNLLMATQYFWRVLPANRCGQATSAIANRFDTGNLACNYVFVATDSSNSTIQTTANSQASMPITVTGGFTVGDLKASINITHTYIEDLTIYIEGPAAIGSPFIIIFEEPCGAEDNINAVISDDGATLTCNTTNPAISGSVKPFEPLSSFNNLPADGVWTLYVIDPYNGDGGSINSFSLDFCNVTSANLSVTETELMNVKVYPNPSTGIVNVSLPQTSEKTILTVNDIQGRQILTKETSNNQETLHLENFSDCVYILNITSGNLKTTKKIILNR